MSKRVHRLKKLQSAEFVDEGPFKSNPKFKGAARDGIIYQSRVHAAASQMPGNVFEEQWIKFKDSGRWYYCRPDIISENYDRVVVVEAKLSLRQFNKGMAQLRLYKPILELIFNRPVVAVLAFKHWIVGSEACLPMINELPQTLWTPLPQLRKPVGWNYIA